MKVLYVTASRVPGQKAHCSQIAQMCRSFVRSGVDFELVVPNRAKLGIYKSATIEGWYGFKESIPVKYLDCIDYMGRLPAWIPHKAVEKSYQLLVWSFNRSLLRYLKQQNEIFVLFSRDIHVYSRIEREFPNTKKFLEIHQLEEYPGQTFDTESHVFNACDGIIATNSLMKKALAGRGVDEHKVLVEYNAVDAETFPGTVDKFQARHDLKLPADRSIVMYAGNLSALGVDKGVGTIVDSVNNVVAQFPGAFFVFVGGPSDQAELHRKRLAGLGVVDNCYVFVGRKEYKELNVWLAAADVLVMPTAHQHFDKVGSPLKLFEYMTAGKPMVVSDLPSVSGIVTHEHNAVIFQRGNPASLAAAIVNILRDPALADELSRNAKESSMGRTWDARAKRILDWMTDLVGETGAR